MPRPKNNRPRSKRIIKLFTSKMHAYEAAYTLSTRDWFNQLHFRHQILEVIELARNKHSSSEAEERISKLRIPKWAQDNLKKIVRSSFINKSEFIYVNEIEARREYHKNSAHMLTRFEAYSLSNVLSQDTKEQIIFNLLVNKQNRIMRMVNEAQLYDAEVKLEDFNNFLNIPYDEYIKNKSSHRHAPSVIGDAAHLIIDLAASDGEILSDIRELLSSARKKHGLPRKNTKKIQNALFNEDMLQKWASNKLLPYIDITLYSSLHNIKLTRADYAEIFNAMPDVDEIRQSIEPLYKSIMNKDTLKRLFFFARKKTPFYIPVKAK